MSLALYSESAAISIRRISAMSLKKLMSSNGVVVTDREGGSSLWPVKGIEVSMVSGVSESGEVENGRVRGLRTLVERVAVVVIRLRAIFRSASRSRWRERK